MVCRINISVLESTASFLVKNLPSGVTFEPYGNEGRFIFDSFRFCLNVDLNVVSIPSIAAYIARQIKITHVHQIEINGHKISVSDFRTEEALTQKVLDCLEYAA